MSSMHEENHSSAIIEPLAERVSAIELDSESSKVSSLPLNRSSEQAEVNLRSPTENGNKSVIPKGTTAKDSNSNAQNKLDHRGESLANGTKYEIEYKASPSLNDHDALKVVVSIGKETFHIMSNYNAKSNSHQPGNHILRHPIREPLSYKSKPPKKGAKDPEVMLLFLLEIVRRRIIDHRQEKEYGGLKDDFHDLPVGLGIAIAYEFMKKDKFFEQFWKHDGKYHMFTGDK
ncbi:unnamed protein product, partial [Rotaria sp. Silwood2]